MELAYRLSNDCGSAGQEKADGGYRGPLGSSADRHPAYLESI